jgi:N-sulfoglucosamine sulfohydrolase
MKVQSKKFKVQGKCQTPRVKNLFEGPPPPRSSRGNEAPSSRFPKPTNEVRQSLLTSAATFAGCRLLGIWLLLLSLSFGLCPSSFAANATLRPNLIVYLADDHGINFVGCYGNTAIRTPNIDSLATQGLRFSRMFAASPTCAPSRAAMYSGLYPARNGLMGNHTACKPDLRTLPHYLQPLGYRVVLANKSHIKPESVFPVEMLDATLPRNPAIQRRYRMEGLDVKKVDQFLAAHRREHPEQPLCLILADNGPHVVWEPNKIYDPAKLPLPPIVVDTPKTRAAMANYYQDITTVDGRVGEVMTSLKRHGFEENTLFIYTADQGPEWPKSKWTVYDTGLRVPFIARWPGVVKPAATTDAMISFVDVLPTFIDLAGGHSTAGLDGRSFKNVLAGQAPKFNEHIFASHTRDGEMNVFPQRCVRDARWKLVLNLLPENKWTTHFTKVMDIPGSHGDVYATWVEKAKTDAAAAKLVETIEQHPRWELYDTQADPYELNNLARQPEHAARVSSLRTKLNDWLKQQDDKDALAVLGR